MFVSRNRRRLAHYCLTLAIMVLPTVASHAADSRLNDFSDLFPDETLATGRNLKVTRNELDQAYIFIKSNKAAQGLQIPERQREALEAQLLDKLITTKLILQRATQTEKNEGANFRDQQLKVLEANLGSEAAVERHIIASGVTRAYYLDQLYEEGVVKAVIERDIKGNYIVPETDIRQAYQANKNAFTEPQSVRVRRIFLARVSPGSGTLLPEKALKEKETLMQDLRNRALKGEDFGALASTHSEDPLTKQRGGEIIIAKGQTKPEFEIPVFALRAGAVSNVLTIGAGLHLVKMLEQRPQRLRPLREVESAIRRNLVAKFVEERLPAYLEKIKREAGVKIINQP